MMNMESMNEHESKTLREVGETQVDIYRDTNCLREVDGKRERYTYYESNEYDDTPEGELANALIDALQNDELDEYGETRLGEWSQVSDDYDREGFADYQVARVYFNGYDSGFVFVRGW